MSKFIEHFVHPQDPILGIKCENTVLHLDMENWQAKGLMASDASGAVYVYINQVNRLGTRCDYFSVNSYSIAQKQMLVQRLFENIADALVFANQLGETLWVAKGELAA